MGKKYYILYHIGAWMITILPTFFLMFGGFEEWSGNRLIVFLFNSLFTILNFYLFFSLLIPKMYDRKIVLLMLLTILFLVFYPFLQYNVFSWLQNNYDLSWKRLKFKDYFLSQAYTTTVLYTGVAYLTFFTIKWISEKQKQADLMNQNQTSELALLRSQINPHFLFNTLNNIYSLVLKKSDVAPEAMMKLSEIMRYMLYETNSDKVILDKEVKYLESYIELLRLRMKHKNFISFELKGEMANHEIAPMLLVPFVENAFKHADKNVKAPGIVVQFQADAGKIEFLVRNYKKKDKQEEMNESGGIGLQNIQRRLKLLYASRHSLNIFEDDNSYQIELVLFS